MGSSWQEEDGLGVQAAVEVSSREEKTPQQYRATESIEFTDGFESLPEDLFTAEIVEGDGSGSGTSTEGSGGYRYGFNGHEQDNEVKGEGNHLSFGDYGYDLRIGRRWNIDPLFRKYPAESPYSFSAGNPILFMDPDGRDRIVTITKLHNDGSFTQIRKIYKNEFFYNEQYGAAGGTTYTKSNIIQNVIIDEKNNSMTNNVFTNNEREIKGAEYHSRYLTPDIGDESGNVRYGFRIYGNSTNSDWQKGLPTAASGSESLDLGKWLDMVGGMREGAMSPSDIATNEKVKYIYEGISKAMDVIDKSVEATKVVTEKEQKSEKPADIILSVHKKKTSSMQNNTQVRTTSAANDKPDTLKNIIYDNPKGKN